MKIDAVVYVNLPSRIDRKQHIRSQLEQKGVESALIRQHIATDGAAYDTCQALCEDAVAQGYGDRFEPYIENPPYLNPSFWWVGIGDLACVLTKLRLYDEIRVSDETVLIVEDDCVLEKSFDEIQNLLADVDADIVQLGYVTDEPISDVSDELTDGFGGLGEYALVITPVGAEFLFNLMLHKTDDEPFHLDELVTSHQFAERVCSVRDPNAWITRRPGADSNRIASTIDNWQENADVFFADDVPGAQERREFADNYG